MDFDGVLSKISNPTSPRKLEKLRLLVSFNIPFGLVENKTLQEIYYEIANVYRNKAEGIGLFKYLLRKAGLPLAEIDDLTPFMTPAEDRSPLSMLSCDELRKLYFHELLALVVDHVGDAEFFKALRGRIPPHKLKKSRDDVTIPNCVRLMQFLVQENTLNPDHLKNSLSLLEKWLEDIGRKNIATIVKRRKDELVRDYPPGPIQDQAEVRPPGEELRHPIAQASGSN